jgi:hypothetical protein
VDEKLAVVLPKAAFLLSPPPLFLQVFSLHPGGIFVLSVDEAEVGCMGVKEYCNSMESQLAAWRNKIYELMRLAEKLPVQDVDADAKRLKDMRSLIEDLGKAQELLKKECLPA